MQITEKEVANIVIYGTAGMLVMVLAIIGFVVFFSKKRQEWDEELVELMKEKRASLHKKEVQNINCNDSTLDDVHIIQPR